MTDDPTSESIAWLLRTYYGPLKGFFIKHFPSEDHEDLTQVTCLKASEKYTTLKDRQRFVAWLYKIAWRVGFDAGRERKREIKASSLDLAFNVAGEVEGPDDVIARARFEQTVRSMSDRQRQCLQGFIQGKGVKEIALDLGLAEGTVISYISRGRERLRKELFGPCEDDNDTRGETHHE
ncbi:MAG: sigma-70 family RNA polymerase sigma factor [Ktedonobacteraceae bacterium]|nr:sigma-70 family RNA polymerase sigma factor [Ktedonobacteraceae bacterium]